MECLHTPNLPPEIWRTIFEGIHNPEGLAHLWTWGRLVSWYFRNIIETVFATKWLKQTTIVFNLGTHNILNKGDLSSLAGEDFITTQGNVKRFSLSRTSFSFKCLTTTQQSRKAIWKLDDCRHQHKLWIRHKLSDYILWSDRVVEPAHHILLLREVNDTELPGMEWDPEQFEIQIDWRSMFNKFLGEKFACDRYSSDMRRNITLDSKSKLDAGRINQDDYIRTLSTRLEAATNLSYQKVRDERHDRLLSRLQVERGVESMDKFEESARRRLEIIRSGLNWIDV